MYSFYNGADLSHEVGRPSSSHAWEANGVGGSLFFGPYLELGAGRYSALVNLYKLEGAAKDAPFVLEIVSDIGKQTHLSLRMRCGDLSRQPTPIFLDFQLDASAKIEVRCVVDPETLIGVRELTIYSEDR